MDRSVLNLSKGASSRAICITSRPRCMNLQTLIHFAAPLSSPLNCGPLAPNCRNNILKSNSGITLRRGMSRRATITTAAAGPVTPDLISVAHELADAAGAVSSRYFRTFVPVDVKTDASPVTIADREAEAAMRSVIASRCPDHAIFGEEQGYTPGNGPANSEYMWVIDPIDGTKSFITGKPLFGTLIALLHNGRPVLGIIDQPILKERWLGIDGQGTTLNGNPITTRACKTVGAAYLYATTPHMFEGASAEAFARLRDQVRIPLYGCDCYAYGLLAAGHCDLVAEADLKPYDYMALIPIIQGAGGTVTDWRGGELRWSSEEAAGGIAPPGEILAAGDADCHKLALDLLAWK